MSDNGKKRLRTPDTPTIHRQIHGQEADSGLHSVREANINDIGRDICQMPIKAFFDSYMPAPKRGLRVKTIRSQLKAKKVLTDKGWKAFAKRPRDQDGVHEDLCFRDVEGVVNAIVAAGKSATREGWLFKCIPGEAPRALTLDSDNRPDCAILLRLRDEKPYWDDIAVPGEFKKDDANVALLNQNTRQIAWDINQVMRNDPSRRFAFGFTIENSIMRLWHADRSAIVVCEDFDFMDDIDHVIEFFAYLMFADRSELGWDPTMCPVEVDGINQYDITVHISRNETKIYRTISPLSLVKAEALCGSATRVWKCIEIDISGRKVGNEPVALKDTWRDDNRDREGDITQKLRNVDHPRYGPILQKRLLTVLCHGDVLIGGDSDRATPPSPELSVNRFILQKPKPSEQRSKAKAIETKKKISSPFRSPSPSPREGPQFPSKVHYRCVFKEVGRPLHEISSLRKTFKILAQVIEGLNAMHRLGYVHRDIASRNILDVNDTGKIADLEYVKYWNDDSSHTVRSGTLFYSPVEVDKQSYIFQNPVKNSANDPTSADELYPDLDDWLVSGQKDKADQQASPEARKTTFVYRPIHDIESSWWSGIDNTINRKVVEVGGKDPEAMTPERVSKQQRYASDLFYQIQTRYDTLMDPDLFRKTVADCLHPSILAIGEQLAQARDDLVKFYVADEKDIKTMDSLKMPDGLYSRMQSHYWSIVLRLREADVQVCHHDEHPEAVKAIKRGRDADSTDITRPKRKKMRA